MPELPEVETVCRRLRPFVSGKTIQDVDVRDAKIIRGHEADVWVQQLIGETMVDVERRGKFILFKLTNGYLVSHLRMEGKFFPHSEVVDPVKHTHVVFTFTDGTSLHYNDVRKFGTMELRTNDELFVTPPLSLLALEPFDPEVTAETLHARLKRMNVRAIKTALLDQSIFVGLGNIYVDETLFRARIHPTRPAASLSLTEVETVRQEAVAVLLEAIERGGSTIRSYTNPDGEAGTFQETLYVYGQTGEPCNNCGRPIEKMKLGGRGTHYCPHCQQ
ncbi:DNA-formamidopyrimidine glycosylase [Exiguobacterium sp. SH3S2]|uniref:DNA-formamidopyrimidine glycosylase n=1 Tax=unclassified Exiguobacterium TaxID=2644629 RepID=UPI00103C4C72|nr:MULTISPECIES: DNA-formamidopyrimidine glycosylase [unclassified Exiguobacterium]TCI48787.1 DNA-formamidopyrimidine glycosylase [Exiguobacterium sp. SH3S3]TCI63652.1 DNA-formamidopyrimidine glycosylase [Exiguobacterium sp. SH3S2]